VRRKTDRTGEAPPAPEPLRVAAIDSHCHLDLMDVPVDEAVEAARAVGITRLVTIGIDVPSSRWQVEAAAGHADVSATVAIHPNEAPSADAAAWDEIARLATDDNVVGVGETGLDHYRTPEEDWGRQEESFRRHIAIAKDTGKALVIHDRDAHDDVLRVLESEGVPEHVVFHCFSGDASFARACVDRGYVLSFAGNITFKNADDLRSAVAITPLDQLLVETDAPFLTPMPYRGRPNASYLVPLTVRAIAAVRGVDEDEVAAGVTGTAHRVFRW
jgi:TatD DNase family protein